MPIIIENMDKPKDCADCPFMTTDKSITYLTFTCTRTDRNIFRYVYSEEIPGDCPIKEFKGNAI